MAFPASSDSLSDYGGAKENYSIGVVDPTTDEDASHRNKYAANVAAMTQTAWRAIRSFIAPSGGATGIDDPRTGFVHAAVWGSSASVKPVGTYVAAGTVDLIWPTMVSDELGNSHLVTLRRAIAEVEQSDTTHRSAKAKVTAGNKVRVYLYSGTTNQNIADQIVTVWVT